MKVKVTVISTCRPPPFVGYETYDVTTEIVGLVADGEQVGHTSGRGTAGVILAKTPFYAEAGGQVADKGVIEGPEGKFTVEQVWRLASGTIVHHGRFEGQLRVGDRARALVYEESRLPTQRNHTATHLLHWASAHCFGRTRQPGRFFSGTRPIAFRLHAFFRSGR